MPWVAFSHASPNLHLLYPLERPDCRRHRSLRLRPGYLRPPNPSRSLCPRRSLAHISALARLPALDFSMAKLQDPFRRLLWLASDRFFTDPIDLAVDLDNDPPGHAPPPEQQSPRVCTALSAPHRRRTPGTPPAAHHRRPRLHRAHAQTHR